MNQEETELKNELHEETNKEPATEKKKRSKLSFFVEFVIYIALILLCVFWVPEHVIQRTVVKGESMENTLQNKDSLLVEKVSYHFKEPSRYDIIVFYPYGKSGTEVPESMKDIMEIEDDSDTSEESELYVKRVFGLPGETIQIIGNDIYINGEKIEDEYAKNVMKDEDAGVASTPITLGEDEYFVLGDNRNNSEDSRYANIGNVKKEYIIGKVWFVISPFRRFGLM